MGKPIKEYLTPRPGSDGRGTRKKEARDDPRRGSEGRDPGARRGKYPKENFPRPLPGSKPRAPGGSHQENRLPNRQVNGPVVREGGGSGKPAGSTKSPWKISGGMGPGNSTKNPKAN